MADYGQAETLANAKNASVAGLARAGVISSGGGKVKLFEPTELPDDYDPRAGPAEIDAGPKACLPVTHGSASLMSMRGSRPNPSNPTSATAHASDVVDSA